MIVGVVGPGEGAKRYSARGSVMFFKAVAEQDDGDFSMMERTLPPGGRRPPLHRHTNCSEAYFVLDGQVSVIVEGEELTVAFNPSYLIDGVEAVLGDEVVLETVDATKPATVRAPDHEDYRYLLMPVRVS